MATEPQPTYVQPAILEVLPEPLLKMKSWLLWRAQRHPKKPGKVVKIPVYLSGQQRKGILDTEADLAELCTLEEALAEFHRGNAAGLGFALTGSGVSAFDLDNCLDKKGELDLSHPGASLAIKAEVLGCYMEISVSGRGLRIVGPSSNYPAYSAGGLEWWCEKRFVVLTGDLWANPGGWVSLDELRSPLDKRPENSPETRGDDDDDEIGIITPRTIEDLREALKTIPSDDRATWVNIGMALKTIGPKGRALWMEWSAKSEKFDKVDAAEKWASFKPTQTNYKTVFKQARDDWGWDPRGTKSSFADEDDEESSAAPSLRAFEVPLGDMTLHPTEFILDGFLPVGVSVIAGAWGAGKSTNLIPLLCSAAHLAPGEWNFRPTIRRKVIWVTEAPEQTRDTLFSIAKAKGSASWADFQEWFRLFRAHRQSPKKLARMIQNLINETTYELPNGFVVNPVVVLDTTSANLDLENESDNSIVSQAMAILKQALPGISLVLVGHTPKALVKADVGDMTFRGAGAWEADAVATYFLIFDEATDMRYLAIRKCRFNPDYREINFDSEGGSQIIDTPWGESQSKSYLHGVPRRSNGEERKAAQAEARETRREEVRERTLSDRQQKILEIVGRKMETAHLVTRGQIFSWIGGKKELVYEAIDRLVEAGRLEAHIIGREHFHPNLKGPTPEIYLPSGVDPALYLASRGTGNQWEPVEPK